MRAHQVFFIFVLQQSLVHDHNQIWISSLFKLLGNKGHPVMYSWDATLGKRKNSDSRRLCLWRFRRFIRTSVRKQFIQDGENHAGKYFPTITYLYLTLVIVTLTSLRTPCRFHRVYKIHKRYIKEKIRQTFYSIRDS